MVGYSWEHSIDFHLNKECHICINKSASWLTCSAYNLFCSSPEVLFLFFVFFPRWGKVVQIRRPSLWIVVSMQENGSALLSASGLWKRSVSLKMKKYFRKPMFKEILNEQQEVRPLPELFFPLNMCLLTPSSHLRGLRCNNLNQVFVLGPVICQQLKTIWNMSRRYWQLQWLLSF